MKIKELKFRILSIALTLSLVFALFPVSHPARANDGPKSGGIMNNEQGFHIDVDGNLWAWGRNDYGQLGDGTTIDRDQNDKVKIMDGVRFLGDVLPIAMGQYHTMLVKPDGSLWVWGRNDFGQLGDGTTIDRHSPVKIMDDAQTVFRDSVTNNRYAGDYNSVVIRKDGSLWAWGRNDNGQLGDGTTTDRHFPVKILDDVIELIRTGDSTMVIKSDFSIWGWGSGIKGQFDDDGNALVALVPVQVFDYIRVTLDGRTLTLDVQPVIINNRTMVPLRGIFEELGASVEWNQSTKTVTARKDDTVIILKIGDISPTVNGQVVPISQPAVVTRGRTLVPLRFIAESLGVNVRWDSSSQMVIITS